MAFRENLGTAAELSPIRNEILLRIGLQNLLLLASVFVFILSTWITAEYATRGWTVAVVHSIGSLALILQWCHHGVRTMQIKKYILLREDGNPDTWERWLPANRMKGILGSRWFISTKGVFLGLQIAMGGLAFALQSYEFDWWAGLWGLLVLLSAWFLLSNPKEGL